MTYRYGTCYSSGRYFYMQYLRNANNLLNENNEQILENDLIDIEIKPNDEHSLLFQ